jgi:hypothetical protein
VAVVGGVAVVPPLCQSPKAAPPSGLVARSSPAGVRPVTGRCSPGPVMGLLLQFEPGPPPPPPARPTRPLLRPRARTRGALGGPPRPAPEPQAALAPESWALHLAGAGREPAGGQGSGPVALLLAQSGGQGGRLARPSWPRTLPTIPSTYWAGGLGQVGQQGTCSTRKVKPLRVSGQGVVKGLEQLDLVETTDSHRRR